MHGLSSRSVGFVSLGLQEILHILNNMVLQVSVRSSDHSTLLGEPFRSGRHTTFKKSDLIYA